MRFCLLEFIRTYENASEGSYGGLIVEVKTARGALPVESARVEVGDESGVLRTLYTDRSGRTERISLSAPMKSLSLTPGIPNSFSTYTVSVSKNGFHPFLSKSVPVFSGITSIQPVELIPESAFLPHENVPDTGKST